MMPIRVIAFLTLIITLAPQKVEAQSMEQRFQDLFITAGYSTAFGAAMGAALIGLNFNSGQRDQKLDPIAHGASVGFIIGSTLGSYVVFSPMFQVNLAAAPQGTTAFLAMGPPKYGFPTLDAKLTF